MNRSKLQVLFVFLLGAVATSAGAQELVVIVNPADSTTAMTANQVAQIYLGTTTSLPAGATANPVDLADGSPLRDAFYEKVAARTRAQVKSVWARLVFSGRNVPPKVLGTSADVKKYVATTPNSIGYIDKSAADSSVKIVLSVQ